MTTAGYLISRAAEQPPILSLTVAIVAVRFFGLARPLARYLERLASHDLALRSLGRVRARFAERIEPLAPAQLEGYRHGDLLARMVDDVDALQNLYLRGLGPPLVALLVGSACVCAAAVMLPAAGIVLAAGLLASRGRRPVVARRLARSAGRRQAAARGELSAELVELLRGAPELVAYGHEERDASRASAAPTRSSCASAAATRSRPASPTALSLLRRRCHDRRRAGRRRGRPRRGDARPRARGDAGVARARRRSRPSRRCRWRRASWPRPLRPDAGCSSCWTASR